MSILWGRRTPSTSGIRRVLWRPTGLQFLAWEERPLSAIRLSSFVPHLAGIDRGVDGRTIISEDGPAVSALQPGVVSRIYVGTVKCSYLVGDIAARLRYLPSVPMWRHRRLNDGIRRRCRNERAAKGDRRPGRGKACGTLLAARAKGAEIVITNS